MPCCGTGLGLGYGGTGVDPDALSYINKTGVISGIVQVPTYSAKNLLTYSNTFTSGWTTSAISVSADSSVTDPLGGTGAFKIIPSATLAGHAINLAVTGASVAPMTFSVYARALGYNYATIRTDSGVSINVDLTNGTVTGSETAPTSSSVTSIGNGWYRIALTYTPPSSSVSMNIAAVSTSGSGYKLSFTGDGTSGIQIYGAQFEVGSITALAVTSGSTLFGVTG